eukprot:1521256-Pyramimonas_sp.AAC.1
MLGGVADQHRKCRVCIAAAAVWNKAARTEMKTCVICGVAQRQECFSDKMWGGVADQHRKCALCIAAAELRNKTARKDMKPCVVCKVAQRRD